MKRILFFAFALALGNRAMAQTYTPVAVTGYNADVVANGAGTVLSSTSTDVDGVNYNFVASTFVNPANASPTSSLPATGLITSAVASTPGLTYQLAPYSGNNSLRINGVGTGTLNFPAATYADQIFVLATTGSGTSAATVTVTYTDNTTQTFPLIVNDWYDATGFAIQGISRVNRTNDAIENSATNPRLYQYMLPLGLSNTSRAIQSITFNKNNPYGVLNVMGITVRSVPAPVSKDAGIVATSPGTMALQGVSQPVTATLMNQGTTSLTSATITWTVDGVAQPSVNWTGNLAPNQSATVALGNFTFASGTVALNVCATNVTNDGNSANNCLLSSLNSCTVLSGTYSIDKNSAATATNFTSLASAVTAMSSCGISGPVTFNVVTGTGPYTEQIEIPVISGASATNTITFNGNGNTISGDPATGNRAMIRLNGADYVKIDNFVITTTGTASGSFGWGIHFINNADNNTISNNTINIGSTTTSESTASGIVFAGSNTTATTGGETGNNNLISNNTITGGGKGISVYGANYSNGNNRLIGNTIKDFYTTAIEINSVRNTLVENNDIFRANRTSVSSTSAGITLSGSSYNNTISKNRIHNTHDGVTTLTGSQYGVYSNSNDAPIGFENIVKNNLIYNFTNNSTQYGLYNSGSDGVFYFHNTVHLDRSANTGTIRGFYQTTLAGDIKLQNNIINVVGSTSGVKHAIYYGTITSGIKSNFNDLMVTGGASGSGIGFFTSNRALLTDWQTGSGDDSISVSVDPQFTAAATGNFLPTNTALNNIGRPLTPAVTDDITAALRNSATPDPGAYEMGAVTPVTNDLAVTAIIDPVNGCNLTNQQQVTITISNLGTAPVTNVPVTFTLNTGTPVNEIFAGPLAPGASVNFTFTTKINLSVPGNYTITASVPSDANPANNSITKAVVATAAAAVPTITAGGATTFCPGGSVVLTAASTTTGATYQWFNNGTAITGATNATYTANAAGSYTAVATANGCPSAASTATTVTLNTAPATPVTNTGGASTTICGSGSVTISVTSPVTGATYQWFNNGTAISGATNATYAANASGSYTVTASTGGCNSAASAATIVIVNPAPAVPTVTAGGATSICAGSSVTLTAASTTTGATYTWFNNGTAITGATSATYTANAAGSYTAVATVGGCSSAASTATAITVNAAPAVPTFTASGATTFCSGGTVTFTATSTTTGVTYQWFNNGTAITGATSAIYAANASGSYTVNATANGCSATSTATAVTVNAKPATPTITANGFVLTSNSATGNQWYLNGAPITGATNATYTTTGNGTYTVVVTANGCSSTASNAVSITNTGIKEGLNMQVAVYPNPSTGIFQVVLPAGQEFELQLTDLTGKVILTQKTSEAKTVVNLSGKAKGIYLLKLVSDGQAATRKLIVE